MQKHHGQPPSQVYPKRRSRWRSVSIIVENVIKSKTSSTIGATSPVVSLDVTQHTVSDLKNKTSLNDSSINADKSLSVIDTNGENNFNAGVVQEIQKKKITSIQEARVYLHFL